MIEIVTESDLETLSNLVNSAYRGESSKAGWATEEHLLGGVRTSAQSLREFTQAAGHYMYKYTENGEIIGCFQMEIYPDKAYMGMITVKPTLQTRGLGKEMMAFAEKAAKEVYMKDKMIMLVISARDTLIAFYERRGYVKTGETKPFPMDDPKFGLPKVPLEFIVMEKAL